MIATDPRIGLALSGGGFRATAFGLGCLRALHDRDLLRHVRVVSGISGGSLLAAMWAYGPESFDEFDDTVTSLLRQGLQFELVKRATSPRSVMRSIGSTTRSLALRQPRGFSRTNSLIAALQAREFGRKPIEEVTQPDLATVITATDLDTMNTMRFGSEVSSCWSHGDVIDPVSVADAVAASAAFPLLLPPMTRTFTFTRRDGINHQQQVVLTDGGVYDNLGLSALMPGRDRRFTSHVYDVDYLIVSDAGRGKTIKSSSNYMHKRLPRVFDITYGKTQDAGRSGLHDAARSGQVRGIVHSYLAQHDGKLPVHLADLVPRSAVVDYATDFRKMSADDLAAITIRGEQLTRVLLSYYCPELGA
ncbi:patatin-like phospholipase family protein [Rhodococcus ruber]|nr:patatin-like phospholipase family protein [Rhodococcus ruber]ETT25791.1 Patatin [Rhodococcus rhodochrous ATCC 21198]MCD2129550.1 patatin-like phospholipase family protein [Rhodococcus ruber]MCZ4505405.1 patatin-like phospholipase family protein [Rhodococcus ruber]MCZ4533513.1 patatin-like phospholipase family protein [Rhodococcus ruber]MCZ4623025.1 patatin-like phospholipase family protein [Rhodococcus ruber]